MYKALVVSLALTFCVPAQAQSQSEALGKCLADSATGRDRKDLARWIFLAMAAHPEIRDMSNVSQEAIDKTNKSMGALVTRLLTDTCSSEVRIIAKGEGSQALVKAFETLGQLAMMELMSNPKVTASISGFERFVEKDKIDATLGAT
jgi:hypothetical protein